MNINRRELMTGAVAVSAVSVMLSEAATTRSSQASVTKHTVVRQGALSGGGYIQAVSISDDGRTMVISYDGSNGWIWNDSISQWNLLFHQNSVPAAYSQWGQNTYNAVGFSVSAVAVAPSDANRIYVAVGSGAGTQSMIWRTIDRGISWSDTGCRIAIGTASPRYLGPPIAVDPANPDVVYISDDAGVIHRTTDGFTSTHEMLNAPGAALNGVLPSSRAISSLAAGGKTIHVNSVPESVSSRGAYKLFASDVSRINGITNAAYVSNTTASSVTLIYGMTGTAGVVKGDTIVFGRRAGIVFDRSSPVVRGKTQGIYIGWAYGASSVYHSKDGGATFFATTAGGPSKTQNICCSSDGIVYVVENSTDITYRTGAWKYQSGAWTNFNIQSPGTGNIWGVCAADVNNLGHVAFISWSGALQFSNDYGARWYSNFPTASRASLDVAWLGPSGTKEDWMSAGPIVFDPVVSGKLWFAEGVGVWSTSPPVAPRTKPIIVWTGRNKGQSTLIIDQILKPPGNSLVMVAQDRAGIRVTDPTREPTKDFGIEFTLGNAINHGWAIDYAKSDPSFQICIVGTYAWKSTDAGITWTRIKAQPTKINAGGAVAAQTPSNFVWFPSNNGTPACTRDGGITWTSCSFNGSTMSNGWAFSAYLNRHIVCADLVDSKTYYAYNYNNNKTGGIWRSTDGGANWENMTGGIGRLLNSGSPDFQLIAMPGHRGHLMFGGGSAANNNIPLMRSADAGATWHQVASTKVCWQPAAGKQAPGGAYPAIFFSGTIAGDSKPGLFRSDNFTSDPTVMPTWTRLCNAPAGNLDSPKSLCADYEEYGTFYLGFGSTGYAYGRIE